MVKDLGLVKDKLKEVVCGNCSHKLLYALADVKEYHGKDYSGGPDGREWVDCPSCGNEAIIRSW
jgi:DNA-directed RNA polymerase subunit RPC12/RpoP